MEFSLGLFIDIPISRSASGGVRDSEECQAPRLYHYPRPLQSHVSDRIFRGSSRMMQIFQWLVSLSPITSLFWAITKNILANVSVENVSTTNIVQRLKALVYKDFLSKLYSLTGVKTPVSKFILPLKAGRLSFSRILCKIDF